MQNVPKVYYYLHIVELSVMWWCGVTRNVGLGSEILPVSLWEVLDSLWYSIVAAVFNPKQISLLLSAVPILTWYVCGMLMSVLYCVNMILCIANFCSSLLLSLLPSLPPLLSNLLPERLRDRVLVLVGKSYSTIRLAELCSLLGHNDEQTRHSEPTKYVAFLLCIHAYLKAWLSVCSVPQKCNGFLLDCLLHIGQPLNSTFLKFTGIFLSHLCNTVGHK